MRADLYGHEIKQQVETGKSMPDPRATLTEAPDMPGYDELPDGTAADRAALPPRFHIPVWNDTATPKGWICAVCWGDSWCTSWPCETARQYGGEIFATR